MVALIGLLKEARRLRLTDHDIAELAYTIEREELGIAGGLQDQYAAALPASTSSSSWTTARWSTRCGSAMT
jgi:galactokinase/mevalonate kinase-like predicted kinase